MGKPDLIIIIDSLGLFYQTYNEVGVSRHGKTKMTQTNEIQLCMQNQMNQL